jgi:hypothetical protein
MQVVDTVGVGGVGYVRRGVADDNLHSQMEVKIVTISKSRDGSGDGGV